MAAPTMRITYDFPAVEEAIILGFRLYMDGVPVGPVMGVATREFTYTCQIEDRPTIFILAVIGLYDNFSAQSEPFEFIPPPEIFQVISSPTNFQVNIVLNEV